MNKVLQQFKPVKLNVENDPGKAVNHAIIFKESQDIACVWIDLALGEVDLLGFETKNGIPAIALRAGISSVTTQVLLPEYVGWSVFAASLQRYTLSVCLIRK